MRESIKIKTEDYNFKFRVSGLIIKNNKILLVDMDNSGFPLFARWLCRVR